MKKSLFALLLVAAMGLPAAAQSDTNAQQPPAQSQESGRHHRGAHKKMDPQARLDRMSKKLNLTADQKAKILPILQSESQQAQSLRVDTSLSKQDKRAKFQQMHQDTMSQIRPILNADQQQKLDAMKAKREKRHQGKSEAQSQ